MYGVCRWSQWREQFGQVGFVEAQLGSGAAAFEHGARQFGLAALHGLDFLLDGAGADQAVDEYRLVLTDAVGAVGGLRFGGRVLPWVVVDHGVGGGEVEADAAGLEADQEHRHGAALEALHQGAALTGRGLPGEDLVFDATLDQRRLNQRQHFGELRKQQHAAAFGQQAVEQFEQGR